MIRSNPKFSYLGNYIGDTRNCQEMFTNVSLETVREILFGIGEINRKVREIPFEIGEINLKIGEIPFEVGEINGHRRNTVRNRRNKSESPRNSVRI
ncbi:hypothetical protein [Neobacillus kokaensis]|uniref:Uncharacterized protein n=1 Tax=Neobacillus kokaensis TaxID=2759023 RepID=A0ABQ3MZH4_9BACI|nr:hypothetical protein [Neobacillus kokaensis]GHH97704.1 hypothetical protein AM1BK_12470 [Neobacillus kokaensis]